MSKVKTKIAPKKACSLLLSLNSSIADYNEYQAGVYECSASYTEQSDSERFTYGHRATGVKEYAVEQKINLNIISLGDNNGSTLPTKAKEIAMDKFLSLGEIAAFYYGVPLPDTILAKKHAVEGVYETDAYSLRVQKKNMRKGMVYWEMHFIGK